MIDKRSMKKILLLSALLCCTPIFAQNKYTVDDAWRDAQVKELKLKSPVAQQRSLWFRQAKLGMFIHWNYSSIVGGEISWSKQFYNDDGENLRENPRPTLKDCKMKEHTEWLDWFKPAVPKKVYDNLYKSFYPGMYNADSIVTTAQKAGVKYIVMVAKHHDGFCMWDSKYTDFDVMSTPFKRDILGEMANACHRNGMKFCIYYSQRDWHHPDYSSATLGKYNQYMRNQISELLTKYAPIDGIFFDADEWNGDSSIWEPEKLFKEIYSINPNIIINNRCGVPGDYGTPEQQIGGIDMEHTWESCMTFTGFWSWHGFDTPVIPVEKCLDYLISCAGGNGNLLMDIGPLPTGQIDPREENRLLEVGDWLKTNGEAIYATQGGPFKPGKWGVATRKGKDIYLIIANWNEWNGKIAISPKIIKSIGQLNGQAVNYTADKGSVTLQLDSLAKKPYDIIKIQLKVDAGKLGLCSIDNATDKL